MDLFMKYFLIILSFSFSLMANDFKDFKIENVKTLVEGYKFTEGPAFTGKEILFTAPREKEIVKWSITRKTKSVFYKEDVSISALYIQDNQIYATQGELKRVVKIDSQGKVSPLAEKYKGKPFNKPNDLWVSPKGIVYFTDPNYGRKPLSQDGEYSYFVKKDGSVLRIKATFARPNGIIGSKDGKKLFITDAGASKTYVFDLDENGIPGPQKLFTDIGGDGMTLDEKGNLYIAVPRQKSLVVINPQGKEIARIPEFGCTNVCFGGSDGKTLFITRSPGLMSIKMPIKGMFVP